MNPFEDENGAYLVLVNDENQHSLWPANIEVPAGWAQVLGPVGRRQCLDYIDDNWVDMRPRRVSLDPEYTAPGQ